MDAAAAASAHKFHHFSEESDMETPCKKNNAKTALAKFTASKQDCAAVSPTVSDQATIETPSKTTDDESVYAFPILTRSEVLQLLHTDSDYEDNGFCANANYSSPQDNRATCAVAWNSKCASNGMFSHHKQIRPGTLRRVKATDILAFSNHELPFFVVKSPSDVIQKGCGTKLTDADIHGITFLRPDGSCIFEATTYRSLNRFLKCFKVTDSIWRYVFWNGEPLEYWRQRLIQSYPDTFKKDFAGKNRGYKDYLEEYLKKCGLLEWYTTKSTPTFKKDPNTALHNEGSEVLSRKEAVEAPSKKRQRDNTEDMSDRIAKRTCSFVLNKIDETVSPSSSVSIKEDDAVVLSFEDDDFDFDFDEALPSSTDWLMGTNILDFYPVPTDFWEDNNYY
jgi:hypothetical protein